MKKEKLYIVFDQLPPKESGGLVATYVNLETLLSDTYDVNIISVFETTPEAKKQFKTKDIHIINPRNIDNRFYKTFQYFKQKEFKRGIKSIWDGLYFFIMIPRTKRRIKRLVKDNQRVIVSSPAAAIFMPKRIPFLLEIHIGYEYFWGKNKIGKLQSSLMTKPTLALFRSKYDATHVPVKFKTDYMYNFFDNEGIKVSKSLVKNRILFMGRLEYQKNPLRLIELAKELKNINDNFTLDIYGNGSMLQQIQDEIKELKLEDIVFYKGFSSDKNIYSKYSFLWLPSRSEGLPLSIIEAKANGIPTITTNWGHAVSEVVENGKDGFIADTNEEFVKCTNQILNDNKLQKELSNNALKNFNKFSKEKAKEKWLDILENYTK